MINAFKLGEMMDPRDMAECLKGMFHALDKLPQSPIKTTTVQSVIFTRNELTTFVKVSAYGKLVDAGGFNKEEHDWIREGKIHSAISSLKDRTRIDYRDCREVVSGEYEHAKDMGELTSD